MGVQVDEKKFKDTSFQELYAMYQWVVDMSDSQPNRKWEEIREVMEIHLEDKLFGIFYYRDV